MAKCKILILMTALLITMTACAAGNLNTSSTTINVNKPTYGDIKPTNSTPTTVPPADPVNITVHTPEGSVEVELTQAQATVAEMPTEYSWFCHDGRIFLRQHTGDYDLGIIYGSNSYIYASVSSMVGVYQYLVDVQTGLISDPLAALVPQIKERISEVVFSADCMHALVFSNSSTAATLLDCSTGQAVSLPVTEDLYSVTGFFCGNSHIILISTFQTEHGQLNYCFTRYNILTGEAVQIPGIFQAADPAKENYIRFSEGGILYTYTEGLLTIIDPLTWEMTVYSFPADATVYYYTESTYIIVSGGNRYLLCRSGQYYLLEDTK